MKTPPVRLREVRFQVLNMRTRMPFKYGIASLSALPHLLVEADVEIDGRSGRGLTAEGLPPKWFTKHPATTFSSDLVDMLAVIRNAAAAGVGAGPRRSVFEWWQAVHDAQSEWAKTRVFPPLLAGLGTSLMERVLLDGFCRTLGTTFQEALRANQFGIRLPAVHPELPDVPVSSFLPDRPSARIHVRHTVGLADPLTEADIADGNRLEDGLPQSLSAAIARYGLTHFKIKLSGDSARDVDRLRQVAGVLRDAGMGKVAWTLDGNEQFGDLESFRGFWERFLAEPGLAALRSGLIVVEQPLHRAEALADATGRDLRRWAACPPMIIDESDGTPDSLRRALELGYVGTSHKNCKGVFRGVANACLLRHRRGCEPGRRFVLTSEDLATVGPVAMLQDLAVAACLGIEHSERNGHHYFRGLSMWSAAVQESVLAAHPDLYRRLAGGDGASFAGLDIQQGEVSTRSVLEAPFGCGVRLECGDFIPLADWTPASLETA